MEWNEYFISIAKAVAAKSKDPNTKVGTVIVDKNNRIVSSGFNGFITGMYENYDRWQRPSKYKYVIHSELNAILYAKQDLSECTLYTTLEPCLECTKAIIASGIKKVYYHQERPDEFTRSLMEECDVKTSQI